MNSSVNGSLEWDVRATMSSLSWHYLLLLVIFGGIGNAASIVAFARSPRIRSISASGYLLALAVSDLAFLLTLSVVVILEPVMSGWAAIPGVCKGAYFTWYLTTFLSGWYTLAVSGERCLVVWRPFAVRRLSQRRTAKTVTVLTGVGALTNAWITLMVERTLVVQPDSPKLGAWICGESLLAADHGLYVALNWMDTVLSFTVPLFGVLILNTLIAARLCVANKKRAELAPHMAQSDSNSRSYGALGTGNARSDSKDRLTPMLLSQEPSSGRSGGGGGGGSGGGGGGGGRNGAQERRVTLTLLSISATYTILNLPSYVIRLYSEFAPVSQNVTPLHFVIAETSRLLFYTQFGVNFLFYSRHWYMRASQRNASFIRCEMRKMSEQGRQLETASLRHAALGLTQSLGPKKP